LLQRDPEAFLDQMLAAADAQDFGRFRELTQIAAQHPAAQEMHAEAIRQVDRQEQQAELQRQQQQREQQEQQQAPRIGARSL
ncbi:MAG: hypothetical protein LBL59_06305, partial [Xanthomonadaceae bacterium]|nr:hypothetical protein [Xanthomonadaceae bacterium]